MKKLLIPFQWYTQIHSEGFVNGWFIPNKKSSKEIKKFFKQIKKSI